MNSNSVRDIELAFGGFNTELTTMDRGSSPAIRVLPVCTVGRWNVTRILHLRTTVDLRMDSCDTLVYYDVRQPVNHVSV